MKYDISKLTLEEKMEMLTGRDLWHTQTAGGKLPEVTVADGPHGLRIKDENNETIPCTAMPTLSTVANSWDPEMARLQGETIANECIEQKKDVLLAPGVNMKRTPLCGRNFEYFSEDPFLAGEMGKAYIEGVQSKGIGTSLKHFFGNNREYERYDQSSDMSERTAHEIYLPAFEKALSAKPWTVMCAYNPVNGGLVSENKKVLGDLLRDYFGFDGLIVSDWHAVHNSARAVKATLDLRMPYNENALGQLKEAYEKGEITEADIDARLEKIVELIEKIEANADKRKRNYTKDDCHKNAVRIAEEGIVLLKNEGGILPLKDEKVIVTGDFAKNPPTGGGGSAYNVTDYKLTPLDTLLENAGVTVCKTRAVVNENGNPVMVKHMFDLYEKAPSADAVIVCIGNDRKIEAENFDRVSIRLSPVQEETILRIADANPNVIVVLYTGSAVDVSAWESRVRGIVQAGFSGEGVNEALAAILTGKVNPSGKLSETYPCCLEDTPTGEYRGDGLHDAYTEGVFIGYRHYDVKAHKVNFPFGHGLSYTTFEYSDIKIEKRGDTDYSVSFTVKNTGKAAGKETAQLYISDVESSVMRPVKELKGFAKIALAAGESKTVTLPLDSRSFAFWDEAVHDWKVEKGEFKVLIGASSRDIRLCGSIEL